MGQWASALIAMNRSGGADIAGDIAARPPSFTRTLDVVGMGDNRIGSPIHSIDALGVPTLLLHADDDPWVPPPPIASRPPLRVIVTRGGGHVGFHGTGSRLPWYVNTAAELGMSRYLLKL